LDTELPEYERLRFWVSLDAAIVLSGAVLTAYVGVGGLLSRMTLDRVLPEFLTQKNPCRKTYHWIILLFFAITSSLLMIVWGDITALSVVYTIAFLSVMSLFAIGNILLKYKRSQLRRNVKANFFVVLLALSSSITALVGNAYLKKDTIFVFALYFGVAIIIIIIMLLRIRILRILFVTLTKTPLNKLMGNWLKREIENIKNQQVVFFTRQGHIDSLNKAVLYVLDNEQTSKLKVIHCWNEENGIPNKIQEHVKLLDIIYPKLKIDMVFIQGEFGPALVTFVAEKLKIQKNFMFIACPSTGFPHNFGDLGGVRLITH